MIEFITALSFKAVNYSSTSIGKSTNPYPPKNVVHNNVSSQSNIVT